MEMHTQDEIEELAHGTYSMRSDLVNMFLTLQCEYEKLKIKTIEEYERKLKPVFVERFNVDHPGLEFYYGKLLKAMDICKKMVLGIKIDPCD